MSSMKIPYMVGWTGARGLFTRSFITLVVWAYADTAATVAASDRRNLIFIRKKLCTCCTQGRAAPENGPQTLRGYQMLEQSLSVVKLFVLQYRLMKQKRLYGMDGLSCVFISTCIYSKYFPNYIGKYDFFIIRISKKREPRVRPPHICRKTCRLPGCSCNHYQPRIFLKSYASGSDT